MGTGCARGFCDHRKRGIHGKIERKEKIFTTKRTKITKNILATKEETGLIIEAVCCFLNDLECAAPTALD
jgi:hypothetical protein